MAKKARPSVLKRQREVKKAEKAMLKRERRKQRKGVQSQRPVGDDASADPPVKEAGHGVPVQLEEG